MSTTAATPQQILEDQLRTDCYALHAARAEVAELQSRHRDVECRYEYLRTVLANMTRSEDNLKRTLAYETATSDAVINAARQGQPLPPALAADAATSVLCPPVHLSGKESHKSIFQSASEVEERRAIERKQLQKEIEDMATVIAAEKRSIGALQHAMYAQAAWGDAIVKKRRVSQRSHAEMMREIEDAHKSSNSFAHDENVLRQRLESQKQEMAAKEVRLQEVEDMTRLLSLQIEEVRSAVTTGKRDLLRAQTLDAECGQVARIASEKIQDIGNTAMRRSQNQGASLLTHASGPMFVSALGANSINNNSTNSRVPAVVPTASVFNNNNTTINPNYAAKSTRSASNNNQNSSRIPQAYPPVTAAHIGDGTHRFNQQMMMNANINNNSTRQQGKSPIQFTAVDPAGLSSQQQQPQNQTSINGTNFNASVDSEAQNVAARVYAPAFGWTAGMPLSQHDTSNNNNINGTNQPLSADPQERRRQLIQNYQSARDDTNEWLRRYVGSMRGLHLTALETATVTVQNGEDQYY